MKPTEYQPCLFCAEYVIDPEHWRHCDGRQGRIEAAALYGESDVGFEAASETSRAAAASVDDGELARLEARVLSAVLVHGPCTCDAVECVTGLSHQTASARIRGLVLRGRIADSGARGRTRSGRSAVLWTVSA